MKREDLIAKVKKTVTEVEPDAEIVLYGSRVRNDSTSESDWDFLILIDGTVDDNRIDQIRHRLYEIEWEEGEVISSIVKNREEWNSPPFITTPFYKNIVNEGVTL